MFAPFALAVSLAPALFDVPTLRGAQVGIYAVSAQTGAEIYERDPDAAMVPASNLKLIVGSAALDLLGPAFTFTTQVLADDSTLYLRGDGDPLLDAAAFADAARSVGAASGGPFTALDGDVSAIEETRYPDGWQQDDLPYDYAAPPSAIGFDENVVQVHVAASTPGAPAVVTVTPAQSVVTLLNATTTGAEKTPDTLAATIAWDSVGTLRVIGSIPAGAAPDDFSVSVLDAPRFALANLGQALARAGVSVGSDTTLAAAPPDARVLWTHHSVPLSDLVRLMWQPSDNLLAESLLNALGETSPAPGGDTRARGLERERAWLQSIGVDPATTSLSDGSGLSAYDRITPRDLVTILMHDWNGPYRQTVLAGLPHAGTSGTLEHAFVGTPIAGHVVAKTGTVNHARTLSGYLLTPRGTIVFSLLVDGWMDRGPQAGQRLRDFQASVLEALANG